MAKRRGVIQPGQHVKIVRVAGPKQHHRMVGKLKAAVQPQQSRILNRLPGKIF